MSTLEQNRDRETNGQTMSGKAEIQTDRWMEGWMDKDVDKWTNGRTD